MGEKPVRSLRSSEYDAFLKLLKELRQEAGLTQKQLCERLQQEITYVSKVERGTRRMDLIELFEYAAALKIDPSLIVERLKSAIKNNDRSRHS